MKVIMLETKLGSTNGIEINKYYKDEIYELSENLYNVFKSNKWCKDFVEIVKEEIQIPKQKKIEVPENKAIEEIKIENIPEIKSEKTFKKSIGDK